MSPSPAEPAAAGSAADDGPRILAVATALPPNKVARADLTRAARQVFARDPRLERLLTVFDHCGVETRHLAWPVEAYREKHSFAARNDAYVAAAVDLGARALDAALGRAGLPREALDHLIFVTTTGLATPSIDALLLERMGLRRDLQRTPLFGVGCAGGAVGMSRASDLAQMRGGEVVVVLSAELCSLTFRLDDLSPHAMVGASLFADGAAAAVIAPPAAARRAGTGRERAAGPRVIDHRSHTFPGTLGVMGWRFDADGFELVLSRDMPELVEEHVEPLVRSFLARHGLKVGDLEQLVVHPGGPRIIDALERCLGLAAGRLDPTRALLRDFGNLSSAAVLFLLEPLLAPGPERPDPGSRGLLIAFGPGFSAELLLLQW